MKLRYLQGYPPELLTRVQQLVEAGRLAETVTRRHPEAHAVRDDRALYDYVNGLRSSHMRSCLLYTSDAADD